MPILAWEQIGQIALPFAGWVVLIFRLRRPVRDILVSRSGKSPATGAGRERVSSPDGSLTIIIPARNEEDRLPACLVSFKDCPPEWQIVVVDDESADETAALARTFSQVTVVSAGPRPPGAAGKSWACAQGAREALSSSRFLLFTDADTHHTADDLQTALSTMEKENLDLATSLPFYFTPTWWERCMAPFYSWVTLITGAFQSPRLNRQYANGQFLLFRAESYWRFGGHTAVLQFPAEDLALARRCLAGGGRYGVFIRPQYRVRMYSSFFEFYRGWRRNFHLGMNLSSGGVFLELCLAMSALFPWGWTGLASRIAVPPNFIMISSLSLGHFFLWMSARRFGSFPAWSYFFYPFIFVFWMAVSLDAAFRTCFQMKMTWRGRSYSGKGLHP